MLEPGGAASNTSFHHAPDDSARVLNRARDCLRHGRITHALEIVDGARRNEHDELGRAGLAVTGIVARLARGDLRGAAPHARELTGLTRLHGPTGARAQFGLGEFAAARGHVDEAIGHFESSGADQPAPDLLWWIPWRSGLARLLAGRGEVTRAADLVDAELTEAGALDSPYAVAYTLRTRAAIAPTSDRIAVLDEALERIDGTGAERLDAQIRTDLAGWLLLLRPGERDRAVELLRSAEDYARREDLPPLLNRVRWLLERLGEHPDGELPGRLSDLSAAERRVAALVITGKRNREVAEALGISVKSVEWHISHILRKLSITSRNDLAEALAQPRHQPR